jgi:hypothetical protein
MTKDTYYFSHDYNSRNDIKIKKLISKHGYLGYGIFWAIIEDLYNNANALQTDYDCIAFDLRCDIDIVKSIINDFDLFVFDGTFFGSSSVENRINERNSKSVKARESALSRWNKIKVDANALPTQSDSNAIKERKVNKSKGNKIIIKEDFLLTPLEIALNNFYNFRVELKKPILDSSKEALRDKLIKLSNNDNEVAIEILNQSIANGWQGIFELKQQTNGTTNNTKQISKYHN